MKSILSTLFLFLFLIPTAHALSSQGTNHEQDGINRAIEEGGRVYLEKGVYEVDGPIILKSNLVLYGDPGAIIRVSASSGQWFTGSTGIITSSDPINNVKIYGFQVDGNCENLPREYANTPNHQHDCENLIRIQGYSNNFSNNIVVHDMKLYNAFSDGLHIAFANDVKVYNVECSNCQHVGIGLVNVIKSVVRKCDIAGITNACLRYDNCVSFLFFDNLFFSYTGSDNNGAWKKGQYGVEIGDAGSSHGFDARDKPNTTTNGEGYNNTFIDIKMNAFELDNLVYEEWRNIYLHDNHVYGADSVETRGIPVDFNWSYENPPTLDESENLFNILTTKVTDTEHINTKKNIEEVHNKAVNESKDKPLINPITILFIVVVGILLIGSYKILSVML